MTTLKSLIKRYRDYKQGYPNPIVNRHCSNFELNNWILSDFIVNELIPIVGIRPFPINELFLMVSAVCRLEPPIVFEWGTHHGKSARIFYETTSKFGIDVTIHSIDLPDDIEHQEHPGNERGKYVRGIAGVMLHQGDGISKSLELYNAMATKTSLKEQRPLFFIDGDHSYDSVKRELTEIIRNVPNANILLHDTFYQSEESGYNIGPYRAIEDTLSSMPNNYSVISTNIGLPGMTLLYQL